VPRLPSPEEIAPDTGSAEGEGEGAPPPDGPQPEGVEGDAWYERHTEKVFTEPDCSNANQQMRACEDWALEERNRFGPRWRLGSCEVRMENVNKHPPIKWSCQLLGQHMVLAPAEEDQPRNHEWTYQRMFEGRDCDDATEVKPDCQRWLDLVKDVLGEAVVGASCTIEPFSPSGSLSFCKLWGTVNYTGYPPEP